MNKIIYDFSILPYNKIADNSIVRLKKLILKTKNVKR